VRVSVCGGWQWEWGMGG